MRRRARRSFLVFMTDASSPIHFVVPHYGPLAYLQTAVNSVRSQSDPNWLLSVIDDGPSTEGVAEWLTSVSDSRIDYTHNESRLGVNANFQKSLDWARAPQVVFLGCDDVLLPEYVATVRALIRQFPNAAMFQPGVRVIDAGGRVVRPLGDLVKKSLTPRSGVTLLGGEALLASLMRGNWAYFPSLCWDTAAARKFGFRQDLPTTLDLALLARLILSDHSMVYDSRVVFEYRRHSRSASSLAARSTSRFGEEAALFHEISDRSADRGWPRASRAARHHITSRFHAGVVLLQATRAGDRSAMKAAASHVVATNHEPSAT